LLQVPSPANRNKRKVAKEETQLRPSRVEARCCEGEVKPKGEKETVVAKDGSRWTKGDMWCEFLGVNNANHSTKGCIAAARENQRKEWGQCQANVASLDPFDDIDSDRDEVFPPTLAIQPTIRRAGASNVVVEPEAITSILSSTLLADRDNKLVLDSGATDTFVNDISFLHVLESGSRRVGG
jgi:hypothetical protein